VGLKSEEERSTESDPSVGVLFALSTGPYPAFRKTMRAILLEAAIRNSQARPRVKSEHKKFEYSVTILISLTTSLLASGIFANVTDKKPNIWTFLLLPVVAVVLVQELLPETVHKSVRYFLVAIGCTVGLGGASLLVPELCTEGEHHI
jgi:hypothetical protein